MRLGGGCRRACRVGGVLLLLVGGCASGDPREGGLFGGLFGIGSGAYDQRVAERTAAWRAEEARYQEEVARKAELDGTLGERRAHATYLERQVALLEGEVNALRDQIWSLEGEKAATADEVGAAEAEAKVILDEIEQLRSAQAVSEQAEALAAEMPPVTGPAASGPPRENEMSALRAYVLQLEDAVDALKTIRDRQAARPLTPAGAGAAD